MLKFHNLELCANESSITSTTIDAEYNDLEMGANVFSIHLTKEFIEIMCEHTLILLVFNHILYINSKPDLGLHEIVSEEFLDFYL